MFPVYDWRRFRDLLALLPQFSEMIPFLSELRQSRHRLGEIPRPGLDRDTPLWSTLRTHVVVRSSRSKYEERERRDTALLASQNQVTISRIDLVAHSSEWFGFFLESLSLALALSCSGPLVIASHRAQRFELLPLAASRLLFSCWRYSYML